VISRIRHGWTAPANGDAYESLLKREFFDGIRSRQIDGYRGIDLLRRDLGEEVEFVTIMWFDSIEAVRGFAGEDYEVAVVPPKARALLSRFDSRSQHHEVKVESGRSNALRLAQRRALDLGLRTQNLHRPVYTTLCSTPYQPVP